MDTLQIDDCSGGAVSAPMTPHGGSSSQAPSLTNPPLLPRSSSAGQLITSDNNPSIMISLNSPDAPPGLTSPTPQNNTSYLDPSLNLSRVRKLSHSSEDVSTSPEPEESSVTSLNINVGNLRSSSIQDVSINSEENTLVSPTKAVFNPLTFFTKGVQNIGSSFDPRKLRKTSQKTMTEEEIRVLKEMKQKSQTTFIEI